YFRLRSRGLRSFSSPGAGRQQHPPGRPGDICSRAELAPRRALALQRARLNPSRSRMSRMNSRQDSGSRRLDDAARAGWLYYVAGNNQEEIARKLGVSRQTAQRLVSLSISEGLIKVRLDHPIARCLELASELRSRYALDLVEVVPSDPDSQSTTTGVAEAAAAEIERRLRSPEPIVMAIGT